MVSTSAFVKWIHFEFANPQFAFIHFSTEFLYVNRAIYELCDDIFVTGFCLVWKYRVWIMKLSKLAANNVSAFTERRKIICWWNYRKSLITKRRIKEQPNNNTIIYVRQTCWMSVARCSFNNHIHHKFLIIVLHLLCQFEWSLLLLSLSNFFNVHDKFKVIIVKPFNTVLSEISLSLTNLNFVI